MGNWFPAKGRGLIFGNINELNQLLTAYLILSNYFSSHSQDCGLAINTLVILPPHWPLDIYCMLVTTGAGASLYPPLLTVSGPLSTFTWFPILLKNSGKLSRASDFLNPISKV